MKFTNNISKTNADYLFYAFLVLVALLTIYVMLFMNHDMNTVVTGDTHTQSHSGTPHRNN